MLPQYSRDEGLPLGSAGYSPVLTCTQGLLCSLEDMLKPQVLTVAVVIGFGSVPSLGWCNTVHPQMSGR